MHCHCARGFCLRMTEQTKKCRLFDLPSDAHWQCRLFKSWPQHITIMYRTQLSTEPAPASVDLSHSRRVERGPSLSLSATTPRERSPTTPGAVSSTRTPSLRSKSQLDSSRIPSRSSLHPGLNPNTRTPTSVGSLHTNRFGLPPRRLLLTTVHARSTFSSVFRSDVDITLFLSTAPVSSSSRVTPARRPILAERSIAGVAVAEIETRSKARGGLTKIFTFTFPHIPNVQI